MANIDVMYSSKTDQWATPDDFFKELDQEFHFNLDPCADEQNHKCEKYFTKEDNGLSKDWGGIACFAILRMVEQLQTGLKRHTEKERDCCYADTSENRHKIFSRLHSASIRNQIREGAFEVREQ